MGRRNRVINRGMVATAITTALAVVISVFAPIAEAAPTGEPHQEAGKAIAASDLPFLESEPMQKQIPTLPERPTVGRSSSPPVAVAEVEDRRSATSRVFRMDDGSLTVEEYSTPIHYQRPEDGKWAPIDNTLRPVATRSGWVKTGGNEWTVAFGPASEGLELITDAGSVSVVPVAAGNAPMSPVSPEVSSPQPSAGPRLAKDVLTETAVPQMATVTYRAVQPAVDFRYEVRNTGVKEDILVADKAAGSRFSFKVTGAELALRKDGGVSLGGRIGDRLSIPAPTVTTADGSDVTVASGARYEIQQGTGKAPTLLTISVEPNWLARQDPGQFPLVIDPSFNWWYPGSTVSFSNPNVGPYGGPGIQVGRDSAGRVWRQAVRFSQYENYFSGGYRVYNANLVFDPQPGNVVPSTIKIFDLPAQPTSWSQISGTPIRAYDVPVHCGYPTSCLQVDVDNEMDTWLTTGQANHWFGIQGNESASGADRWDLRILLSIYQQPPPTVVANIANGQVLSTLTPTLEPIPVPNADDGTPADYRFQVTTGPQPNTGLVWNSDYCWPADKVEPGILQEGVTYYAWVFTGFECDDILTPPTEGRKFTVNLGLGEGGVSPTDAVGSVPGSAKSPAEGAPSPSLPGAKFNVGLTSGNLSVSMGTKALGTLSGGVSLGFTYNSSLVGSNRGLKAEFFNDTNNNGEIDAADALVATRTDQVVAFNWGSAAPVASQDPAKAMVRWTGTVSLPAGSWQLGARSAGGVRIKSGSTVLLDHWALHSSELAYGSTLPANVLPIQIEWRRGSGDGAIYLQGLNNGTGWGVRSTWLTGPSGALPVGWTLNGDAGSARWVGLRDLGTSVSLIASDGSGHEFKAKGNGVYEPPLTAPSDLLTLGDAGRFVLQTEAGQLYTFRSDGALESLVNNPADDLNDLNPAALEYAYSGSPLRLRTIHDRVSNRTVNLYYGGDTQCGSVPAPASGMLCQIAYWDNTVSTLTYEPAGRLTRFTHPGDIVYDLSYYGDGRLKSLRDPLAADAVAAGVRTDDATVLTEITYDTEGRVSTVTQPVPAVGSPRPQRTYTYSSGQGEVDVAGFTPSIGFAERVRYDSRNRITERTDAAGLTTTYTWDAKDRQIGTTDPAGLRATTHYDHQGRATAKYGPAPASSFDANGFPVIGATVPLVTTEYDGGIVGLAATYWTHPNLAGPPGLHGTGLGTGGDMDRDWGTSLPVSPGPQGWSARFSGVLKAPVADTYYFAVAARGKTVRVWVDDTLFVEQNSTDETNWRYTSVLTPRSLSAGDHTIRVDMVDAAGPAALKVSWSRNGAPTSVTIPGASLAPNYGLVTSTTDADGKVSRIEYSDAAAGIGPEYRLPTATVSDPAGTNLRTVTTYESPGPGSFLRRIARTLPAGNATSTTNYGGTELPLGGSGTSSIGIRATSVGQNVPPATTVVLPKPAGTAVGEVMIAAVAVRGVPTVTAPSGWTLIRSDSNGSSMKLLSYWRVATGSEPVDYTWSFSSAKAAAGTITAYTGVNTTNPVDVVNGLVDTIGSTAIVAPAVTTTGPDERLIGLFSIMKVTPIAPPTGMQELAETSASAGTEPPVTIEAADTTQPLAGASGNKTATAGTADRNNGQLIALRPLTSGPCSVPLSTPQGGKPKRITSPDPDGAGPQGARVEEFVYDSIGRQVGRRVGTTATIGTASWSCTTYDARGRLLSESWPATTTAPARTVTHLYAVGGNPLINAVSDTVWGSAGVTATVDLLGRVVSYSDIYGDTTTTTYDQAGRVTNVNGPGGNRIQSYTAEGRPGPLQVDGVTMATPTYNTTTGRLTSVAYANGTTTTAGYDSFGRTNATSTANGSATTITGDQVTYSVGGRVKDQQVYTGSSYVDANGSGDNYVYDGASRLTDARLPGTTYGYGYGTSSGCTAPDAGKNTNRSTLTVTGTGAGTTSYCYDQADRLVSSTDYAAGTVVYDDRGNTTRLGDKTLDFDASDRHVRTETPATVTRYWRDPLNRIADRVDISRTTYIASSTATAAGTAVTVNRPAGTQTGDLVVAGLTIANAGTLTAAGWNIAATQVKGTQRTWVLWRYATATDPASWTFTTTGTTQLTGALATYRGPTSSTPITVTASTTTSASTSHPLPQVTTTSDANQLLHVVGFAGVVTPTTAAGTTQRAAQSGVVSLLLADRYQSSPGTSGAANATTPTATDSTSLTVAILPGSTDRHLGYAGHSDSPSHLDDSTGALIERYYGLPGRVTITEKATTEPATTFSDDFTGTNGAVWNSSKWTTTSNDSTKKVDIQSNQGLVYVNGASARATATMTPVVDSETTFSYRFSDRNAGSFLRISTKASGATGANQMPNAYRLEIASNSATIVLQKFFGSSVTPLDSFTHTTTTTTQRVRLRVQGSTIQAKVWADGTAEPAAWSLEATDSIVTDPGVIQIAHSHTSGARSVYLDDLVVTSGVTPDRIWSYSNLHGDVTATTDNTGNRTWIGWYGPYGENFAGSSPANQGSGGASWGWHGQQQRQSDRDLVHMGARPYAPNLGRFLAVDPVEGGCANDYVYVFGDPMNASDLNGKFLDRAWNWAKDRRCALLQGASIGLGIAAVFATGGTAAFVLAGASIALGIAAPLSIGNRAGAEAAVVESLAFLYVGGFVAGAAKVGAGGEIAVGKLLAKTGAGGLTVLQSYNGMRGTSSACG